MITRRQFLSTAGKFGVASLGASVIGCASGNLFPNAQKKPNILFVLVDDQRNTSLGCAGHSQIKTPNIDWLARNGVRFENAFVTTPICMASRACLFTGMTERSHGYTGGGYPANPVIVKDVDTSFPTLLRSAGYRTGFFGKQHVKFQEGTKQAMNRMFDVHKTLHRNPYFKTMPDGSKRHVAEVIGDKSVEFLKSNPADKPFFLYMSFNISHAEDKDHRPGIGHFPWPKKEDGLYEDIEPNRPDLDDPKYYEATPDFLKKSINRERYFWRWDTPEKYRTNMRAYYRMLTGMDRIVKRVQDTLEELGQADNTIVIYSADNGYYMGDRGFAGKWSHYEQSLRVPLIIYDPRLPKSKRGKVVDSIATSLDISATIIDKAGLDVCDKYQGRSLTPLINGKTPSGWRREFYCEHLRDTPKLPKWYGVRSERFTYANYFGENVEMLHDLKNDPTQLTNLADKPEYKKILEKMRKRSQEYVREYTRPEIVKYKQELKKKRDLKQREKSQIK